MCFVLHAPVACVACGMCNTRHVGHTPAARVACGMYNTWRVLHTPVAGNRQARGSALKGVFVFLRLLSVLPPLVRCLCALAYTIAY